MVSWISHALLGLVLVCGFLLVLAWAVRPAHVQIRFTRIPPVVARVNRPSRGATAEQRRVVLPTGDLYIAPEKSKGHFVMVFDWQVPCRLHGRICVLTVRKLSTTDFASIPQLFHSLISPLNNTIYSAIVHDYLYADPNDPLAASIDRATADRLFYWGMRARGVWRVTAGLMYIAVRLAGAHAWKRTAPQALNPPATSA